MNFWLAKNVLPKKDLLQKAATLKRFQYSLKAQTSVAEKQYQGLNKLFKPDEKEEPVATDIEKSEITNKSNLMYHNKYSFSEYRNFKKCSDFSFMTKYDRLLSFYHRLNNFRNLTPRIVKTKLKKKSVFKNAANLYNTLLTIYFKDYNSFIDRKKKKWIKIWS